MLSLRRMYNIVLSITVIDNTAVGVMGVAVRTTA